MHSFKYKSTPHEISIKDEVHFPMVATTEGFHFTYPLNHEDSYSISDEKHVELRLSVITLTKHHNAIKF